MRSFDYPLIKSIITDRSIYDHISDDGSPSIDEFEPFQGDDFYYLVFEGGLFMFHPWNHVTVEVHVCVLPKYRGKSHIKAKEAFDWMFENTKYKKIIAQIPEFNTNAFILSKKSGMELEGINRKSFMKNSKLYDQYIMGVVWHSQQ